MLTAKDLLYKAIDFEIYWNNSKDTRSSEPGKARKAQVDCLLKLFGIAKANEKGKEISKTFNGEPVEVIYGVNNRSMNRVQYVKYLTEYKYFSWGEFLLFADLSQYKKFLSKMRKRLKGFPGASALNDKIETDNLTRLFHDLYQVRLHGFLLFRSVSNAHLTKESRIETYYSNLLQTRLLDSIKTSFAEIDEVLATLIDPANRSFDEKTVGYPEYDLVTMDAAYWEERFSRPPSKPQ